MARTPGFRKRNLEAYRLKQAGLTYAAIGRHFGRSRSMASLMVFYAAKDEHLDLKRVAPGLEKYMTWTVEEEKA